MHNSTTQIKILEGLEKDIDKINEEIKESFDSHFVVRSCTLAKIALGEIRKEFDQSQCELNPVFMGGETANRRHIKMLNAEITRKMSIVLKNCNNGLGPMYNRYSEKDLLDLLKAGVL